MRLVATQGHEWRCTRLASAFLVDGHAIQEVLNLPRTIERSQDTEFSNVERRFALPSGESHCTSGIRLVSGNANITAAAAT
jgi:hypothetical protein